jgi:hypothetical protein
MGIYSTINTAMGLVSDLNFFFKPFSSIESYLINFSKNLIILPRESYQSLHSCLSPLLLSNSSKHSLDKTKSRSSSHPHQTLLFLASSIQISNSSNSPWHKGDKIKDFHNLLSLSSRISFHSLLNRLNKHHSSNSSHNRTSKILQLSTTGSSRRFCQPFHPSSFLQITPSELHHNYKVPSETYSGSQKTVSLSQTFSAGS